MQNLLLNHPGTLMHRLLIALLISLLAHLWVLLQPGLLSAKFSESSHGTLQIKLAPSVKNALSSTESNLAPPPAPTTSIALEASPGNKKAPISRSSSSKPASTIPESSPTEKSGTELRQNPPQTEATTGIPEAGATGPASEVDIEFEITSGSEKTVLGSGHHHYASIDGEYFGIKVSQTSAKEGTSQIEQWKLDISGRINLQGLSPVLFQMQGTVPELLMTIKKGQNEFATTSNKVRSGRMPDGILDRQSLLYQFMMRPPVKAGGKLWLTDGENHGQYSYYIAGAESLRIGKIGEYRTIKIVVSADEGTEIIELWLLPESHYLPAKVRHTDERGMITEQSAVTLTFK